MSATDFCNKIYQEEDVRFNVLPQTILYHRRPHP